MLSMTMSAFSPCRIPFGLFCLCLFSFCVVGTNAVAGDSPATLAAHWPLVSDARAAAGSLHAASHGGVQFKTVSGRPAAVLNGRDAYFEVGTPLRFGTADFSVATWVHPDRPLKAIPGNLLSCWDPLKRQGWNLSDSIRLQVRISSRP